MTGRKKHLRVLKDLRIQHEAYISTDPNAKSLKSICRALGVSSDWILDVKGEE